MYGSTTTAFSVCAKTGIAAALLLCGLTARAQEKTVPAEAAPAAAGGQTPPWGACPPFHLRDEAGKVIDPVAGENTQRPYSPKQTCGRCHDYQKITRGYHFTQGKGEEPTADQKARCLWASTPGNYGGTWCSPAPLYRYLSPKRNESPALMDMTSFTFFTSACAGCHPGGGSAEFDRQGKRYDLWMSDPASGLTPGAENRFDGDYYQARWSETGVLEADCLLCHHVRDDLDDTCVSCADCHATGKLGAPVAKHRWLPPLHLEQIACQTCHIPRRAVKAALVQAGDVFNPGTKIPTKGKHLWTFYGPDGKYWNHYGDLEMMGYDDKPTDPFRPVLARYKGKIYPVNRVHSAWPAIEVDGETALMQPKMGDVLAVGLVALLVELKDRVSGRPSTRSWPGLVAGAELLISLMLACLAGLLILLRIPGLDPVTRYSYTLFDLALALVVFGALVSVLRHAGRMSFRSGAELESAD